MNVKINSSKSIFGVSKIKYLGYYIDGRGISPDVDRIQVLKKAEKPKTCAQLRSFLGFMQYYSKFVPNFSKIAQPLFDVLTEEHWTWSKEADVAYTSLIESVINGRVLKSFEIGIYSELIVDASEGAIGAVLEQKSHLHLKTIKSFGM
jgi:hypothetical protein